MTGPHPCEHTKNRYATDLTGANWISETLLKAHNITSTKKMGSNLLHAKSQKPEQSQITEMCCFHSWDAYQTNYPFSQYEAQNYVHFSPCLQQTLSPHVEKKIKYCSWENELNHTHVNTKKLRKMFLPISRLHCTFNLLIFVTIVNTVLGNNTKQKIYHIMSLSPHVSCFV